MDCSIVRRLTVCAGSALILLTPLACSGAERIPQTVALGLATAKSTPTLPLMARQLKVFGPVEVEVFIDETGAVEKAEVLRGNPILGKAAVDCVKTWKFKPYKQGDAAVKAVTTLAFQFNK
jgi:protein TonB